MKYLVAVLVAIVIMTIAVSFVSGGSSTDSQPPAGVQINVSVDSGYVSVAVVGVNSENWLWNDGNNGAAVAGNWEANNECAKGQGRYSGEIKFWQRTSPEDYAKEPSAGQQVTNQVDWESPCEPSGMTVQVFMPGQ